MTKQKILLSLIIAVFTIGNLAAQSFKAEDILGHWFNEEKDAKVEIYVENGKYFGKVVWLEEPNEEDGKAKLDDENPDEELAKRPIMGLLLMINFDYEGDGEWENGDIYDPKSGKTYSCYMKLESNEKLKVRGFIGVSWIGRTTYWTRP